MTDSILDLVFKILKGEVSNLGVFQCSCGELMVARIDVATTITNALGIALGDLPCKACGGYENATLDLTLVNAIDGIAGALAMGQGAASANPLLDFIPSSSPQEFEVGLHDVIKAIEDCMPAHSSSFRTLIQDLGKKASSKDIGRFSAFVNGSFNFATLNLKSSNCLKAYGLTARTRGETLRKRLLGEQQTDSDEYAYIQSLHSAYLEIVEETEHLKVLENLRRLADGLDAVQEPFSVAVLPPQGSGGKPRKVDSLATTSEYIDLVLPTFGLGALYDNHLRNAKGHNEYRIDTSKKEIELLRYSEAVSLSELERTVASLLDFVAALDEFISEGIVSRMRATNMPGILNTLISYDVPALVGSSLVPVGDCLPELVVYQQWSFKKDDFFKDVHPNLKLTSGGLEINVVEKAEEYTFPLDDYTRRWLKQVLMKKKLKTTVMSLAPPLPNMVENAIVLVPWGKQLSNKAYVLSIAENIVDIEPALLADLAAGLGFDPESKEAHNLIQESQRLGIVMQSDLTPRVVRAIISLRGQSFDTFAIPLVSSVIGLSSETAGPKEVVLVVQPSDFDTIVGWLKQIKGGFTSIEAETYQGLALLVCTICSLETWKAVVFPLHFSANLLLEIREQLGLRCCFRDSSGGSGREVVLELQTIDWKERSV